MPLELWISLGLNVILAVVIIYLCSHIGDKNRLIQVLRHEADRWMLFHAHKEEDK